MSIEALLEVLTLTLGKIEEEGYWLALVPTLSHNEIKVYETSYGSGEPTYVVTDDDEITEGESSWVHFKRETDG